MRSLPFASLLALASGFQTKHPFLDNSSYSGGPVESVRFSTPVPKSQVKLRALIRVCSGGSHGIFWSDFGEVRKPFTAETINWQAERAA